jgi:hypothetical protein
MPPLVFPNPGMNPGGAVGFPKAGREYREIAGGLEFKIGIAPKPAGAFRR